MDTSTNADVLPEQDLAEWLSEQAYEAKASGDDESVVRWEHVGIVFPGTCESLMRCRCGRVFPATPHPTDPDVFLSAGWMGHVQQEVNKHV